MRRFGPMLALYINGTHIGNIRESFAHKLAKEGCEQVGDSATLYTLDPYDHMAEECVMLYYRNSMGVQERRDVRELDFYSPRWDEEEKEETYMGRLRDNMYAKVHTERTYGEQDHKHSNRQSSRNYMSFIKRQERRSARKLGKAHIKEQMAA